MHAPTLRPQNPAPAARKKLDWTLASTMASTIALTMALTLALNPSVAQAAEFALTSPNLASGKLSEQQVFNSFGCSGQNISPALRWSGAPAGTKSFAITAYDPDAPTGSGWWHWVVYNLPANITALPEGAGAEGSKLLPKGAAMGPTDFGTKAYGGACPPPGKPHRYIFTVHALKVEKIDVPANATAAFIGFNLNANRIGQASITATYGR
jgi:Raf kinase inhibitor-like YbhB/YbcL family protein